MSETSIQDGRPVYKFAFAIGSTDYLYTSASYDVTDSNGTYTAAAITLTNIITTSEMSKNGIRVTLPRDNALALLFVGTVPEKTTSLTVYKSHDSTVGDVVWKGRVASAESSQDTVTLNCEDVFTSMQRPGLRARYQKGCRHPLYSTECGVTQADFGSATTITAVSGRTVTVAAVVVSPGLASDYFVGGIIELADGSTRHITEQSGWDLTVLYPFNESDVTSPLTTCTIYPGCNHTTTHCSGRFNNLANYGGFPYLPGKNPFKNSVTGSVV